MESWVIITVLRGYPVIEYEECPDRKARLRTKIKSKVFIDLAAEVLIALKNEWRQWRKFTDLAA
jgi:hypothetical protein